jgi:hypothetical protein
LVGFVVRKLATKALVPSKDANAVRSDPRAQAERFDRNAVWAISPH